VIVTRTPLRISFLGGGTDYPDHFRVHGGQSLAVAIDKYSYIALNPVIPLFEHSMRISYSRMEVPRSVDEIEHPSVRECLRFLKVDGGVEVHHVGDLPARTGLGSSSSFTVGLLHALHASKGEIVSRQQLAAEAVYVEQELIRERVGVQDQYTCALGGLLHLRFDRDGSVRAVRVPLARERLNELQAHLMLFYTGIRRDAHEVLEEQLLRTKDGELAGKLGQLAALVDEGLRILAADEPIARFGELLDEAWRTKRELSRQVSTPEIDGYYERALKSGAVGGKLLGAGGGGFLLVFAEPSRQSGIETALRMLPRVNFGFDERGACLLGREPDEGFD